MVRVPVAVREDLHGGSRLDLLSVFLDKNIFIAIIITCRVLLKIPQILCGLLPFLISKNGDKTFSQPFSSCCVCVNSGFPNFRSNYFWHIDFSWNKVVQVDSTAPINATPSEKV